MRHKRAYDTSVLKDYALSNDYLGRGVLQQMNDYNHYEGLCIDCLSSCNDDG